MRKFIIKTTADYTEFNNYIAKELYPYIVNNLDFKPFDVTIERHKEDKTPKQLKGFFRLCQHIAPYLQDMTGEIWDKDRVRYYIELRAGFSSVYMGVATPRSLTKATKEEMMLVIENLIVFGNSMDIPDCILTSDEKKEFNNYYGVEK